MLTAVCGLGVLYLALIPLVAEFEALLALSIFYAYLASILVLPSTIVVWHDVSAGHNRPIGLGVDHAVDGSKWRSLRCRFVTPRDQTRPRDPRLVVVNLGADFRECSVNQHREVECEHLTRARFALIRVHLCTSGSPSSVGRRLLRGCGRRRRSCSSTVIVEPQRQRTEAEQEDDGVEQIADDGDL